MEFDEFDLIERFKAIIGSTPKSDEILGIGDDTAVLKLEPDYLTLLTCDILIEDVHFSLDYISPFQLGQRAMAVNMSDIAAMGGQPVFALTSLALPVNVNVSFLDDLYKGMIEQANKFETKIIGGNLSKSPEKIMIDLFMLGKVLPDQMLTRSGAKPGDRIFMTGETGSSAAGLNLLKKYGKSFSKEFADLVNTHLQPIPRINAGRSIAACGYATAMIDISDGLAADLGHIMAASHVGVYIYKESIPISGLLSAAAGTLRVDKWQLTLSGGEDYELLFTMKPETPDRIIAQIALKSNIPITEIGEITTEVDSLYIIDSTGGKEKIETRGWKHF